jgi:hypothetical protein
MEPNYVPGNFTDDANTNSGGDGDGDDTITGKLFEAI